MPLEIDHGQAARDLGQMEAGQQPEQVQQKRWLAMIKQRIGTTAICLNIFSILLLVILNYAIDTNKLDRSSPKFLFLDGLESHILETSLYSYVLTFVERFLDKTGYEYTQTTYDVWKFVFVIIPYIGAGLKTLRR